MSQGLVTIVIAIVIVAVADDQACAVIEDDAVQMRLIVEVKHAENRAGDR